MKKLIILLLSAISSISKADLWTAKANYPTISSWNIFFSIEGKGYVGAGESFVFHKDFWEYDPVTNVWTQKADYGGGLMCEGCSFSIGSLGYAGLGYDTTFTPRQDFWEYNPFSNVWTQKANFIVAGRTLPLCFSANGYGYVGMGSDSVQTHHNDLWQYDPVANVWIQKTPLPAIEREGPNSFVIGNSAYVVGGATISGLLNQFWEYNTVTDTWSQKSNFPFTARCCGVAFSICQKGYFGTGSNGSGITYLNDFWEYDPATGAWTQKTSFPGAGRMASAFFTSNGKAYVGTGVNHTVIFNDFYEYTPDSACITGLNPIQYTDDSVEVFPNPASGFISVKIHNGKLITDVTLKITDLKGKVWQQANYSDVISEIKIRTADLASGIYLLQFHSADLNCVKKIVVQ